jgi:hypothetical protein
MHPAMRSEVEEMDESDEEWEESQIRRANLWGAESFTKADKVRPASIQTEHPCRKLTIFVAA